MGFQQPQLTNLTENETQAHFNNFEASNTFKSEELSKTINNENYNKTYKINHLSKYLKLENIHLPTGLLQTQASMRVLLTFSIRRPIEAVPPLPRLLYKKLFYKRSKIIALTSILEKKYYQRAFNFRKPKYIPTPFFNYINPHPFFRPSNPYPHPHPLY